ncbi:MAG: NAD-binding protein [Actinobacteria bacterium]|nr:NAD-binding protein [Actinomycetota bacterium]
MHIIITGCGRVGSSLANYLSYEGHDVVVIDKKYESFKRLGGTFNGITYEGVAFDEEILLEAGIEKADAFAAVTNVDNTNVMACEIAINVYGVPSVISRLYSPHKELTFFVLNIDYICGTTLLTDRIREKLFQGDEVIVQQERFDVGIQIVEFIVPGEADGKPAGNLDFGVSSKLIALLRNNRELDWNEHTLLRAGDRAVINMRKEGWRTVKECLGENSLESPTCRLNVIPTSSRDTLAIIKGEPTDARVIIAGCSEVGSYLAYIMSMEGHRVTVIDNDSKLFSRLSKNYDGMVMEGNVYDEHTLINAGIEEADAFVAVTKFDNTNLMAAEVVRNVFDVPYVMARVFNPDKEATYQALNLSYVCGTRLLTRALLERIQQPKVRPRNSCCNNLYNLIEFECPDSWEGKNTHSAKEKSGVKFAYITRRNSGYFPDNNFMLKSGDTITALATEKQAQKLERYLRKH